MKPARPSSLSKAQPRPGVVGAILRHYGHDQLFMIPDRDFASLCVPKPTDSEFEVGGTLSKFYRSKSSSLPLQLKFMLSKGQTVFVQKGKSPRLTPVKILSVLPSPTEGDSILVAGNATYHISSIKAVQVPISKAPKSLRMLYEAQSAYLQKQLTIVRAVHHTSTYLIQPSTGRRLHHRTTTVTAAIVTYEGGHKLSTTPTGESSSSTELWVGDHKLEVPLALHVEPPIPEGQPQRRG
jgi:hypothetical protein